MLNGGVSGYGFDQIVLRAERLAAIHAPSMIIVCFIADDVRRTEMRRLWGRDKPWFAFDGDRLELAGVPVPDRRRLAPPWLRHRLDRVLISLPAPLQQLLGYHVRRHPTGEGLRIALHLFEHLVRLGERHRCRVVLLAQYHPTIWLDRTFAAEQRRVTELVLVGGRKAGLAAVDTFPRFAAEPAAASFYINTHLNGRGNAMIARLLAARLPKLSQAQDQ